MKKNPAAIITSVILAVLVAAVIWKFFFSHQAVNPPQTAASPVPAAIVRAVNFPIYYPDPRQLPSGYTLDDSSFKQAQPGVIIYSISHTGGQPVIISEEEQPSNTVIDGFAKDYIPLHTTFSTNLGQVQIGANGKPPNLHTLASLPINHGPWLIATAPSDIKIDDMKQIMQSLRR